MQVVCTQCHAVCDLDVGPAAASDAQQRCSRCTAPLSFPAVEVEAEASWLVLMPSGQAGPYSASHMAELFEQANLDWTSLVWRSGLKGWRPARRDPQLVTAVASARGAGAWGDTQRVAPRRSPLPAADTIVDVAPGLGAPPRFGATVPSAAWTDDSDQLATQAIGRPPAAASAAAEPTFADAFRSAPAILATAAVFEPSKGRAVTQRQSSPTSWLPSAQSMALVAVVAFGFGVLAAAVWGRMRHPASTHPTTVSVRATPPASAPEPQPIAPAPPTVASAVTLPSVVQASLQEVPNDAELRREVKRVSPDIRRCVDDLSRGADLEVYFDGPSGRARDVRLKTQGLTPGRVACITQAARQMQVEPFLQPTHKFWHRFSY
ncbi:MAG TPA: GYF domain-containing protein [Polyangiales bacterium]